MSKKTRLGRGLSSLIHKGLPQDLPDTMVVRETSGCLTNSGDVDHSTLFEKEKKIPQPQDPQCIEISISAIQANPHQPRKHIDPLKLQELAHNIQHEGLLQPIVVRKMGDDRYELIAGERRLQACRLLATETILARILTANDSTSAILSLVENLQREQLDPIEEALAFSTFMKDFGITQDVLAQRVGKDRSTIANSIRLLNLSPQIQNLIASSQLSAGHAKVLLSLEDVDQQHAIAKKITESNLSVRETELYVQRIKNPSQPPPNPHSESLNAFKHLEKKICQKLNTPVTLKPSAQGGRIIIDFSGHDELQRILKVFGV